MKPLLITMISLISASATTAQVKGLDNAKMDVGYLEVLQCECLCSVIDGDDTTYFITFDSEYIGKLTKKHIEKLYIELERILKANGRPVDSPDAVSVTDYATHPVLSEIQKKLSVGNLSEERFDYVIGDYIVAFMYSWYEYEIIIYRNPYAGQY
jgi:hypothetical protein